MPKTGYQITPIKILVNGLIKLFIRLGLASQDDYILTVKGRKTGKRYTIPVKLVQESDRRWLVAPYGEVNWVRNTRAAGQVTLAQKGKSETVAVEEVGPEESAPVLKQYLKQASIVQPYFDARPDSPLEAFAAEAHRHPVFRIGAGDRQA